MAIETTIHTLRHAHTAYNAEKRYAGSIDIPLNEKGITEARQAAPKLAHVPLDVVVTSTLRRSIETAEILVGDRVPIVHCELCNERNFGVMEGLTWANVQYLSPPVLFVEVGNDLHSVNPKGGEPFEVVWSRAQQFRHYLFEHYEGLNILVVSHGVFLQMLHGVLRNSNCIESLCVYPSNLELACFQYLGSRLVDENVYQLNGANAAQW
jgi:probable phosphoglycerate mutase